MRIAKGLTSPCVAAMFFLGVCLALPGVAHAATYWVSPTGAAAWASCTGATTLSGTAACSLGTANSNAAAGDTVYLRGGTYGTTLQPANSGTLANRIVFAAYTGETPVITVPGSGYGFILDNNSYVKITGITFKNNYVTGNIRNSSHHNELSYNVFIHDPGNTGGEGIKIYSTYSSPGTEFSTHNWIHHNYFSRLVSSDPCGEGVDWITIGHAYSSSYNQTEGENYNTIEDNYFEYVAHTQVDNYGTYTVIKNNISHNEPWITGCTSPPNGNTPIYTNFAYNGMYGHRNFQLTDDYNRDGTYVLVEGNRLGHASNNPGNNGPMNLDAASGKNIIRYNYLYNGMQTGMYFKYGGSTTKGSGGSGPHDQHIYNNTIYHNGYGYDWVTYAHDNYDGHGVSQYCSGTCPTNNVIKNNIVYDNGNGDICNLWTAKASCSPSSNDIVVNNWTTANGDPKFVNPDVSDTLSQNLFSSVHGYATTPTPNLALQSSSPAIDGGTYLAQANGSGSNSTTLVVNDASYFQDGTWGSDLARGVTLFPDWIAIGTVKNTVQIRSINYATNTITLASPMTWSNGAPVWLYKKSDGAVVLAGAAPDYGANEYAGTGGSGSTVAAPTNLQAVVH